MQLLHISTYFQNLKAVHKSEQIKFRHNPKNSFHPFIHTNFGFQITEIFIISKTYSSFMKHFQNRSFKSQC